MIKFEKVSYEQWAKDFRSATGWNLDDEDVKRIYDNIKLPKRSTKKSGGYDFYSPITLFLGKLSIDADPNTRGTLGLDLRQPEMLIPTGIRAKMDDDVVLLCWPRSGQGFKYGIELANTTGVIDADYYNAANEGHIMAKLVRKAIGPESQLCCEAGQAFMQGIFTRYLTTDDDDADGERTGGFGSTDKKE